MALTRDQILSANDLPTELVSVPEWGGEVLVRGMSGVERDAWEADSLIKNGDDYQENRENIRARLVARCIVGEDGNRLFTDEDVAALGRKSGGALDRIFTTASRLSGLTRKDVEDLAKN